MNEFKCPVCNVKLTWNRSEDVEGEDYAIEVYSCPECEELFEIIFE